MKIKAFRWLARDNRIDGAADLSIELLRFFTREPANSLCVVVAEEFAADPSDVKNVLKVRTSADRVAYDSELLLIGGGQRGRHSGR